MAGYSEALAKNTQSIGVGGGDEGKGREEKIARTLHSRLTDGIQDATSETLDKVWCQRPVNRRKRKAQDS